MRVLAIGECMAELAPAGAPGTYRLGFAGDTFNTAWYLARLAPACQVAYLSAVGTDRVSQDMRDFMAESGVDTRFVRQIPERSAGLYLISLNGGERSFSYWRGQSAARCLADDPAHLEAAMAAADMIYLSGITLAILPSGGRENLLNALKSQRKSGKTIVFDPNLRPALWPDTDQMCTAIMRCAALSHIVLPSFEDEARWFEDAEPSATIARYKGAGADTVIVKDGGRNVTYRMGDQTGTVAVAPVTELVDSTAAGDSFNAAFLAQFQRHGQIEDAIDWASGIAGQVVMGKGALVPVEVPAKMEAEP